MAITRQRKCVGRLWRRVRGASAVVLGVAGTAFAGSELSWTTRPSMQTPRCGLAAANINGILYAVGGTNGMPLGVLESLDPQMGGWLIRGPMSTARVYLAAAAVSGQLYAIGGDNGSGPVATVEAYNPGTGLWTTKAPMPTARSGLAAVAVGGTIYAIGGLTAGSLFSGVVEAYDPATNSWTAKSGMLTPRERFGAWSVSGKIYAVGGENGLPLTTVEVYDPVLNSWSGGPSMLLPRSQLGVAHRNGALYAIGGGIGGSEAATDQSLDDGGAGWNARAGLRTPRTRLAVTVQGSEIYAIGGLNGAGYLATVESAAAAVETPVPPAGEIRILGNVLRIDDGGTAMIVVHGKPGGAVTLVLYAQSGNPVMQIGQAALRLDDLGVARVTLDGRGVTQTDSGGDTTWLKTGVYFVVATGDVTDRKPLIILTSRTRLQ